MELNGTHALITAPRSISDSFGLLINEFCQPQLYIFVHVTMDNVHVVGHVPKDT